MKQWSQLTALALVAGFLAGGPTLAQDPFMGEEAFLELLRSDVRKETTAIITNNMNFSAEEAAAFWPVYKRYQDEIAKIGDKRLQMIKEYATSVDSLTDEQADQMATDWFNIQRSRIELLNNLYSNVSEALTPLKAMKVTQLESRFDLIIDMQIANELPMVE